MEENNKNKNKTQTNSSTTSDGSSELGGGNADQQPSTSTGVTKITEGVDKLHLKKKKLSGAAKRRLKRAKLAANLANAVKAMDSTEAVAGTATNISIAPVPGRAVPAKTTGAARNKRKMLRAQARTGTSTTSLEGGKVADTDQGTVRVEAGCNKTVQESTSVHLNKAVQQKAVASQPVVRTEGPLKRNRSDGQSPEKNVQKKKARTAEPGTSYRDSLVGIPMVVLPVDYPDIKMDNLQVGLVRKAILEEILKTPAGTPPPQFLQSREVGGLFKVTCASQESKLWLEEAVKKVKPWDGANLKAIEAKDLPKFTRVVVWVPKDNGEPATILRRLEIQNPPLKTNGWKLMGRKADQNGQTLAYSIDDQSYQTISARRMRLFLNFSTVTFKVTRGKREEEAHPCTGSSKVSDRPDEGGPSEPATL